MSAIYYNKEADTAFRVRSKFGDGCWCVTVKTNNGRSKMNAREFAMNLSTITEEVKAGKLFALYDAKTISRDINLIRAGLTPPQPEGKKKQGKPDENFKFYVGSLIDTNPSDYVAICNQYGEIIGHEYNGKEFKHEQQAEEIIEEPKNVNQLNLF